MIQGALRFVGMFGLALGCGSVFGAVVHVDDFQNGLDAGWVHPSSRSTNPPLVLPDAGPDEDGDFALQNRASGNPNAGGRFVVVNRSANWTGSFAGIGGVSLDVLNEGGEDRFLRIGIEGAGGRFVTAQAVSPFFGGSWTGLEFSFDASSMTAVDGGTDLGATLLDAFEVRIIAGDDGVAAWRGVQEPMTLLFDNVAAVPEPSVGVMILLGGIAFGARRRRL